MDFEFRARRQCFESFPKNKISILALHYFKKIERLVLLNTLSRLTLELVRFDDLILTAIIAKKWLLPSEWVLAGL